jgi:hypothetical protein
MVAGGPRAFERRSYFLFFAVLLFAPKAITYHQLIDRKY